MIQCDDVTNNQVISGIEKAPVGSKGVCWTTIQGKLIDQLSRAQNTVEKGIGGMDCSSVCLPRRLMLISVSNHAIDSVLVFFFFVLGVHACGGGEGRDHDKRR
jgi:hypothetical protein